MYFLCKMISRNVSWSVLNSEILNSNSEAIYIYDERLKSQKWIIEPLIIHFYDFSSLSFIMGEHGFRIRGGNIRNQHINSADTCEIILNNIHQKSLKSYIMYFILWLTITKLTMVRRLPESMSQLSPYVILTSLWMLSKC